MPPKYLRKIPDPLLDPASLQRFLRTRHLPPLRRFGQHLLVSDDVLQDIATASETDPRVPVIEIGAGLGTLTRALARVRGQGADKRDQEVAPLIAVELDRRLIPPLRERVREFPHVRVVHADILRADVESLLTTAHCRLPTTYDVIGNIPYNITAPIFRKFLAREDRPRRMTILVDEAVASVIVAEPPRMSLRAVSVQVYAKPAVVGRTIPPTAFIPPPAVRSAILTLTVHRHPLVSQDEEHAFFRLVRAGFSQKRKTLRNALSKAYRLTTTEATARLRRASLDPSRRGETLSITEWKRLLRAWGEQEHPKATQTI